MQSYVQSLFLILIQLFHYNYIALHVLVTKQLTFDCVVPHIHDACIKQVRLDLETMVESRRIACSSTFATGKLIVSEEGCTWSMSSVI